jgi:hypothetical protein
MAMSRVLNDAGFAEGFSLLASDIGLALHGNSSLPGREMPEVKQACARAAVRRREWLRSKGTRPDRVFPQSVIR